MSKEIIVVVTNHRKFGELFIPYITDRIPGQSFFQLNDIATFENIKNQQVEISEPVNNLVKIYSEYSDKEIHKIFSKKKNLKEFFDSLDDNIIVQQIRPFIEKKIVKCFNVIVDFNIPVYRKTKHYPVIHDEERIIVPKNSAQPVFNFIKTDIDFKYFLSIRLNDNDIKLFNKSSILLSNKPCIFVVDNSLYYVENIDSKKLFPFFKKDLISIPKTSEREYLETFVKNAILNYPVKAIGFKIIEIQPEYKAKLILDSNLKGEPILVLKFYYTQVAFLHRSSEKANVLLEEQNGGYTYYKYHRNSDFEFEMAAKLESLGFVNTEGAFFQKQLLTGDIEWQFYEMINWINFNINSLHDAGFEIDKATMKKNYYLDSIQLDMEVEDNNDWFDLKANVKLRGYEFPFSRFRKHINMGIREFTLPDNQVVILPAEWFSRYSEIFVFGSEENNKIRLKKYHFQLLHEAIGYQAGDKLLSLREKLNITELTDFNVPEGLEGTLREYQKTGITWMQKLYENNFGGCLADDMGLGKTIQTIALLLKVKNDSKKTAVTSSGLKPNFQLNLFDIPESHNVKPLDTSLIVMPVSLIHNWEKEINKFAPSLKVYKFFGSQRTRSFDDLLTVDVVLASYGVVRNDIESLSKLNFNFLIIDESQFIKNPDSKIYKAVIQLQSKHKLVLTGTPIENSLTDLWTQLNFINRDLLKSQHYFREEFVTPIEKYNDSEKQRKLQILISPFILRRKKEEVVKELPSLTEQVIYCEMTEEQQKIYETEKSSIRNHINDAIEKQGFNKSSIIILKALNRLRLLANHPALTEPGYTNDSGKFEEIIRSVENVVQEQHKVLIFSSYVKHLNLLAAYLKQQGISYNMLTGITKNRKEIIESFQDDENKKVFLISLKAGGTGLNLTAADYVFILDPWWNPASENQAISRAHRIGQDKKVFVYRFISYNTVEEKIQLLQQKKSALSELFINNNNPFRSFNKEEIEELFK